MVNTKRKNKIYKQNIEEENGNTLIINLFKTRKKRFVNIECGHKHKNSSKISDLNLNIHHYIVDNLTNLSYKDGLLKIESL